MASRVLDDLSTTLLSDKSAVFCYTFCNFYRANEERAENMMCNLLKQLCQIQSPLPQSVEDLFARHRSQRTQPSLDEAASALRSLISAYPKAFIVVGGLDECEPSSASQFVSTILDLLVDTRANFFAISRSLPSIIGKFREHNSIIIDMPSNSAADDIGQYIKSNAERLPDFVNHSHDMLEQVTNTIIKYSDGLFRTARFLLDSIVDSKTPESMMDTLEEKSRRNDTLDAMMTRIRGQSADRRDLAMNTLLWMAFAFYPLEIRQLQHALAVEAGESSFDEANIPDTDDVASVCAGLVVIDTERDAFRFCNKSVESWIIERRNKLFPDAQLHLTRVCLTYLSFTAFESGIALSVDDLKSRVQLYPLYDYAARYWGFYALEVPECPDILLFLGKQANVAAAAQVLFLHGDWDQTKYAALPGVSVAIHLAAHFSLEEAMKVLLNVFDVDLKAYDDWTPLMVAAIWGKISMVELLLAEGADIEARDSGGRTALSLAVFRRRKGVVDLLISHGAKVNFHDGNGSTPLLTAIDREDKAMVQLLLARGADIELKSKNGEAPAAYAAKKGYEDIASLLLAAGPISSMGKNP
ncbi:ANK_REP_REGION domain-containing protein [Trichoderma simmonsii]|uniref:ANK_REP_REGION domain-containing protein n=1 Tax=Trichoderma simmonsii TaxID=1491479 RepID=A0A8G0LAQ4_9HYPO|nr:ANK_REP_REGION domain-containing protein [Trichoderma simmonsii]